MPPAGIRRIAGQKSHKVTPILYLYRIYIVRGNNLYIRYLVLHQRPDVVYVNSDNPSDVSLLADYTKYMSKYADMVEKFDKWESEDLNDAELAYYIDVQARVSKKLLEVAG